jgi:hypothetical protein
MPGANLFTPPTPPTLPNFLENGLFPYRFKSVGRVGGVIRHGLVQSPAVETIELRVTELPAVGELPGLSVFRNFKPLDRYFV